MSRAVSSAIRALSGRTRPSKPPAEVAALTPLLVQLVEGRSGSTLLMALLGTSPDIVVDRVYPYENRYLAYLSHLVWQTGEPFRSDEPGAWTMSLLLRGPADRFGPMPFEPLSLDLADFRARLMRHAWQAFSESTAAHSGLSHRYYAEKDRGRSLQLLAEAGITPRILQLVRDPRDIVASVRAFDDKRGHYGFGRLPGSSDQEYLVELVAQMAEGLRAMDTTRTVNDCRLVRYEDLAVDLDGTARGLSEWLGVTLDPRRRDDLEAHLEAHATSSTMSDSVGRWRRDLGEDEAGYVASELAPWMTALGYGA